MTRATSDTDRISGFLIAGGTAVISGVSVFINSYGVRDFRSPAVYTTAKNLVATIVLVAAVLVVRATSGSAKDKALRTTNEVGKRMPTRWRVAGFAYIGVIGGGVAFILFFDGLARTAAAPAAFLHDTLVLFVGLMAWPALRERLTPFNLTAIALLIGGEVAVTGGVGQLGIGDGPVLVLGATVLWAIETVVAKRLLAEFPAATVALTRMGIGVVVLVGYLAITGHLGALGALNRAQLGWTLLTGLSLAAYVATWFTALARARAIDVTSVLVGSVVVASLLQRLTGHSQPSAAYLGIGLILVGIATIVAYRPRRVLA